MLVDPCPRDRAPKAREAGGTGPRAWGPPWTPMDPHMNPVKHTWANFKTCKWSGDGNHEISYSKSAVS